MFVWASQNIQVILSWTVSLRQSGKFVAASAKLQYTTQRFLIIFSCVRFTKNSTLQFIWNNWVNRDDSVICAVYKSVYNNSAFTPKEQGKCTLEKRERETCIWNCLEDNKSDQKRNNHFIKPYFLFQSNHFHNKLNEILDFVSNTCVKETPVDGMSSEPGDTPFGMQFPDLFVY